jgi:RHS repeat-associated protein
MTQTFGVEIMTNRISRRAIACALLATTSLTIPAAARAAVPAPKFVDTIDDHGVDLANGLPFFSIEEGGIGSGPGAVRMTRIWSEGAGFLDNWSGGLYDVTTSGVTKKYIQFAGISDTFSGSGTTWTSDKADGSTLVQTNSVTWTYTARDGTAIAFHNTLGDLGFNCPGANPKTCRQPVSITYPTGLKFTLIWDTELICIDLPGEPCGRIQNYSRLTDVSSSAGYSMAITYQSNTATADMTPSDPWFTRTGVTFDNLANHPSPAPAITYAHPSSTEVDVTDPASRTWKFFVDTSARLTGVRRPGSASNNISYGYGTDGTVNTSTKDGVTNTYARSVVGSTATVTTTDPLSGHRIVVSDLTKGRPTSDQNELGSGHATAYTYDTSARLTKVTAPEGNYVQYAYDARGNVQTQTLVPKIGSGLSNIVTSASFDATCTNIVKCNQPNSTTDPKGNVTDYTYDPTHGGVLTITQPAAAAGGTRPQTRLSYTQVTSAQGDLVYMLTETAACQTLASCTNGADETQVVASYNSNLLPTSVTRQSGDGSLVSTKALTYDSHGNLSTVNGPLADTNTPPALTLTDTTAYKYDAADQLVGAISADPDGFGTSGGPLPNRAIRLTYRPDGQVSKQELGTTNGQDDTAWAAFTPLQTIDMTFDSNSRPTRQKLSASGTSYALTQTSYDALGRVDCSAVRMNTAVYGSLPASACTLSTQGSDGPDRVSQAVYDAAGEVTQNKVGVGTSDAATDRTLTYTNNGLVQTLKDAENNLTTYEYDGFDRLSKTRFPLPTKGSNASSTTDYEQLLNYDANSNVGSRRLRDGTSIAFTYDKLDRVTLKDLPGTEPDVTYGYDLLGRLTSANQSGNNLTFTYDALSRNLTQVRSANTHVFTVSSAYDAAGRRTQLTYPAAANALAVTYDYLTTGELTAIKQSGASLASYTYDNLGNRTALTFANGVVQNFTYDPVSRLASLSNDLPGGSTNDLTIGTPATPITYNPASQIASVVRSNDAYAFTPLTSGTTNTTSNGLNQQVNIGGATVTWDSKGNLTSDPTSAKTYGYSSENLLTSASGGVTLGYESLNRLYQVVGASTTRFLYDGLDSISEYDGNSALLRRFVFDPTTHQPLVWYEGTGNDSAAKRYLSADERGSIVSITDSSGALIGINTYDEYGKPGASNTGRFQYTGQKWLSEIGAYDYKARVYLPHLGVFGQTDPIGYSAGANLYAYVGDDPANGVDSSGLCETSGSAEAARNTGCVKGQGGPLGGVNFPFVTGPLPDLFPSVAGDGYYDDHGGFHLLFFDAATLRYSMSGMYVPATYHFNNGASLSYKHADPPAGFLDARQWAASGCNTCFIFQIVRSDWETVSHRKSPPNGQWVFEAWRRESGQWIDLDDGRLEDIFGASSPGDPFIYFNAVAQAWLYPGNVPSSMLQNGDDPIGLPHQFTMPNLGGRQPLASSPTYHYCYPHGC